MLKLWTDGVNLVVAESKDEAVALYGAHLGDDASESAYLWREKPADAPPFTIGIEDCPKDHLFPSDAIVRRGSCETVVTMNVAGWIDFNGRGYLASTEW